MKIARNLRARLADLRGAQSAEDLIAGSPEVLDTKPPGRIAVTLGEHIFIIFCANHESNPLKNNGELDWSRVSRIKVLLIGAADE